MNELNGIIKATEKLIREQPRILREVAVGMTAVTSDRIFNQGLDSKNSNIGTYSREYIKQRTKKGLGASSKVVVTLTGQLESDFGPIVDGQNVGLGVKNSKNADKIEWVEGTYKKDIFSATPKEEAQTILLFNKIVNRIYSGV